MTDTYEYASRCRDGGISVIPIRADGSKQPALATFNPYKGAAGRLATDDELVSWWGRATHGVAALCGAISGGLELIDFDGQAEALFPAWRAMVSEAFDTDLMARLCVVRTPREPCGYHVWLRWEGPVPGNLKLARDPGPPPRTLIETRGEGGYALLPCCPPECHECKRPYVHVSGPAPWELAPIGRDEREALVAFARSLSREQVQAEPIPRSKPGLDLRPGDHFDQSGWDWPQILEPHGWTLAGRAGNELRWARPGKKRGWSATTGHCHSGGADLFRCFSSNADPFEEGKAYGKFRTFALLNCAGDLGAAAKALRGHGFGSPASAQKPRAYVNGAVDAEPPAAPPLPKCYAHDELLDAKFPPQTWLLDSLVPSGGLVILGGKKKLGKSWLCMQIAQAIAGGVPTLGRPALPGPVAYLCLEDGDRRLQDRLMKQRSPRGLPIRWFTSFGKLDQGGLKQLEELMKTGPRLVVIDTLAAAKTGKVDENNSGPMGDIGNALHELAQKYHCSVLIVHHHGKFSYGDPGDDLRGSSALAAAADLNLGLYRLPESDGYRLRGEGKDIEAFDYAVTFDAHDTWQWKLLGDARVTAKEEADASVLFALANLGEAEASAVAQAVGRTPNKTRDRLNELVEKGKALMRIGAPSGRGQPPILYRLPPPDAAFATPFDAENEGED